MHQIALASYLPTIKIAANFDKRGDFDNDCYFINTKYFAFLFLHL